MLGREQRHVHAGQPAELARPLPAAIDDRLAGDDAKRGAHRAGLAASSTRSPFTFYVAIALIYLALTSVSIFLLSRLEARYSLGVKKVQF